MWEKIGLILCLSFQILVNSVSSNGLSYDQTPSSFGTVGRLVKKEERMPLVSTEFGAISAVDVGDGTGRHNYHLQFITLERNSLFLPVLLHADMVFYVHTGSGRLSWADVEENELRRVELQRGDVYRIRSGSVFYLESGLESERPRLRIIAIFANDDELELLEPSVGPYYSINDLIRGFDRKVLQAAFQVPEEVIEELTSAIDTPAIIHAKTQQKKRFWEKDGLFINALLGIKRYNSEAAENKRKQSKSKAFNFFKGDPDFHNCNGWSTVVTKHHLDALHGSHIGVFMVNLTKGSMMGPHWNPKANEVSVVLEGEGMVRVVCPSTLAASECKNTRFRVEEGDVYTVPRFHPMAQISFNNDSLVFMGFSTTTKKNHPQFLAGKASVLQTLDKLVLGASFDVSNTTIGQLLSAQEESVILECTSCAEGEEVLMEEEIEAERREEERREEKERKRREEEERRRREEEEEQQRREEDERRRKEEEERKRREEEERRRREEEERQSKEEEERKRREEEERRRREEESRRREEEESRRREEEEEQSRRREEEESEEEEEQSRRREEEESRRREEEEEQRRREEEQRRQEEEQRRREEEEERQEEEEQRRQEEEEAQRKREAEEEEEQRRREEEEEARREEQQRREEEEQRQEEEAAVRQREEERRRREEWRRRRSEEERRRREEEGGGGEEETEEEAARREEEERVEIERSEEEAARRRREHEHPEWDLVKMARDRDQNTGGSKDAKRLLTVTV